MGSTFSRWQIVRYYSAGLVTNIVGYIIFLLLVSIGIECKLAASLIYLVGVLISFYINREYVFVSNVSFGSSVPMLILMMFLGYVINMSILFCFVDVLAFDPGIVQLMSALIVSLYFFIFNRFFVHRESLL